LSISNQQAFAVPAFSREHYVCKPPSLPVGYEVAPGSSKVVDYYILCVFYQMKHFFTSLSFL